MNEKHIEAVASQVGVDYGEALARMTVADVLRIVDANESRQDIERALRANLAKAVPLPAWQDVLGDAEQLVRQKYIFAKYIKGTILENDVPVWIADFALRLLQRDRAARGMKTWQHDETGRITEAAECPGPRWAEVPAHGVTASDGQAFSPSATDAPMKGRE